METSRGLEEITISHDDQPNKTYSITTPRETIVVSDEYLMNNVVEYALIRRMWFNYNDHNYCEKLDNIVCVFDEKIFIVVLGKNGAQLFWLLSPGQVPATLFIFDVETNEFLYAGYRQDFTMIDRTDIKIVKTK